MYLYNYNIIMANVTALSRKLKKISMI